MGSNNFVDIANKRFGMLTAIEAVGIDRSSRQLLWLCRCDCGNQKRIIGANLRFGRVKSCGCSRLKMIGAKKTKHGLHGTPGYSIWKAMCLRGRGGGRKASYADKGVAVCPRWRDSFRAFIQDMGVPPSPNHSIDRKDNSRGYEPDNCRWATPAEQARNRDNNLILRAFGEAKCAKEWSEDSRCAVAYSTLVKRVSVHGWSHEMAITTKTRGTP